MTTAQRQLALVTGGSSGIGRELAKELARNGYDVMIAAEPQGLEAVTAEVEALGSQATTIAVDLATDAGVEELVRAYRAAGRPLAIAAINAGVGVGGAFATTDLAKELNMIDLNVRSTVHLAKRVLEDMTAANDGKILFTASIAAIMPDPYEAVYGGTKAFVRTFAEALRTELKDTEITVTALMPGPTETNFFARAEMMDTKVGNDAKDDPAQVARQGIEALMAGKSHVIAGSFKTKAQAAVIGAIPGDDAKAKIHEGMAAPGSAKN